MTRRRWCIAAERCKCATIVNLGPGPVRGATFMAALPPSYYLNNVRVYMGWSCDVRNYSAVTLTRPVTIICQRITGYSPKSPEHPPGFDADHQRPGPQLPGHPGGGAEYEASTIPRTGRCMRRGLITRCSITRLTELRPPLPDVRQWTLMLGRLLAVVSWQRVTDDGVPVSPSTWPGRGGADDSKRRGLDAHSRRLPPGVADAGSGQCGRGHH